MDGHKKVWRVVRQNAMTLEALVLKFFQAGDVSGLVIDEYGEYVAYPRLHKLEIRQIPAWRRVCRTKQPWHYRVLRDKVPRPVFPGAVPFPVLGHLYMGIDYPFKDDTVFRGNADTLMYLDVKLYPSLADVISKYEVFTAASHPRLQCVKTHGTFSSTLLDLALGIVPHAPVRMMGDAEYFLNTRGSALPLKEHPCIRVLSLPDMKPWHETVLELFGLLPNLVELCTKPVEFYSIDDSIPKSDIYNVYSDKILAGNQFRIWRFVDSKQAWRSGIVSTLRMMAKTCSAFDFVSPQAGNSEIFEGNMEDLLWVRGFKQRGGRLWQIITE
ncbi:hypothetical protein H4S07_000670 [Coemansia furcata]|uniref:Uncharacterized protein n=1 Tax=Coemansia furcata TaxID=417177 RepID=A0ACC1LQJ2_9FUNG|nr:hypothetical protein H4S07_000670 [Coemansia furcata]